MIDIGLQLIAHGWGDYILQSHWMATEKTSRLRPAISHGLFYIIPFIIIGVSITALLVILISHIIIDRYRLARHVVWIKDHLSPTGNPNSWSESSKTGYPSSTPDWLAVWLMIICDNILHITINLAAINLWPA